jgi:hypothetical protein
LISKEPAWPLAIVSTLDMDMRKAMWCINCWPKSSGAEKKHGPEMVFQHIDFEEVKYLIEEAKKLK